MGGFDRKSIKPTTREAIQAQEKEQQKARPTNRFTPGEGKFLSLSEGENILRIYPFHPDGGGKSFAEFKTCSFLPIEVPKRDADRKIIEGEFQIINKSVFNSKVHGGTDKDLVEEYIKFLETRVLEDKYGDDEDKKKAAMKHVTGYMGKDGKFVSGIKPGDGWVMYVDLKTDNGWEFGPIEVKPSVKVGMNKVAQDLNTPDPFTDPDNGIAVIINFDKAAGKKDPKNYYSVSLESELVTNEKGRRATEYVETPLSDAQLDKWFKVQPLYKRFRNAFTNKDFLMQLEGLERFDKKHGFGVFSYEEFDPIVTEIEAQVAPDPEKEEEKKEEKPKTKTTTSSKTKTRLPDPEPVEEEEEEQEEEEEEVDADEEEEGQNVEQRRKTTTTTTSPKSGGVDVKSRMDAIRNGAGKKK